MIGRDGELGELRTIVECARAGQPAAVIVRGAAGVGKTRLLEEALLRFADPDDVLMVGHCVDLDGEEIPYSAVADALRDLVRRRGSASVRQLFGAASRPLGVLAPSLGSRDSAVSPGVEILDALLSGLSRVGDQHLPWLWLEDVQWADRATRAMLSYLLRVTGPRRLLVTCSVRTGPGAGAPADPSLGATSAWVGELLRLPAVHEITLRPFTRPQVRDHLRELIGGPPRPGLVDRVAVWSGGLPFYTEVLSVESFLGSETVPETLSEMVLAEVAKLDANGRTVVEAASVEGGRLAHEALAAVVDSTADTGAGVATAVRTGMLVPQPAGFGYRFRHELLRESIVSALLPADRVRWHARWAYYLDSTAALADDPFARIAAAHHWVAAGDRIRAFEASLRGAQLARDVLAPVEEARFLVHLLDLWPQVPDAEQRAGVDRDALLRHALVLLSWAHELGPLARLLDSLPELQEENPVRDIYLRIARAEAGGRSFSVSAEDVQTLQGAPPSNPWLARTAAGVSAEIQGDDPVVATELAELAVRAGRHALLADRFPGRNHALVYEALGPELDLLNSEFGLLGQRFAAGRAEEAAQGYAAILPRCAAVSKDWASGADLCRADALAALGRHREALSAVRQGLGRLTQPVLAPTLFSVLTETAAYAHVALGEWDAAFDELEACRAQLDEDVVQGATVLTGVLHCWRGDLDRADELAAAVREILGQGHHLFGDEVDMGWLSAELAAARGDVPGVRAALAPLWRLPHPELCSDHLWRPLLLAVRIEVDEQDGRCTKVPPASREHLDDCQRVAAALHRIGTPGIAWDLHMSAELSRLTGSTAPDRWRAVVEAWRTAGHVHEQLLAEHGLASCLAAQGQSDAAAISLQSVVSDATSLRALPLITAAGDLARRARISMAGQPLEQRPPPGAVLTERELEVLRYLTEGRTNQQIAAHLFISPKTASVHVSRILTKLQVQSRTEAAAVARRRGLVTTD